MTDRQYHATRRGLLQETASLATKADESGFPVLCIALMLVVRGSHHSPRVCQYMINAGACILDMADEIRRSLTHPPAAV